MKIKTKKTVSKRFKVSKSGKLIHAVGEWNHLRGKKSSQSKYRKGLKMNLSNDFAKKLKELI